MSKKILYLFSFLIIASLILVACGGTEPEPAVEEPAAEEPAAEEPVAEEPEVEEKPMDVMKEILRDSTMDKMEKLYEELVGRDENVQPSSVEKGWAGIECWPSTVHRSAFDLRERERNKRF